jgi:Holliday junction DNA helicase RuvB
MIGIFQLFLITVVVPLGILGLILCGIIKSANWIMNPLENNNSCEDDEEDELIYSMEKYLEDEEGEEIEEYKNFEFRPSTWEEFIGQEKAKEQCKLAIAKTKKGIRAHALIDGLRGHGKTSLAYLVRNYLNADMIEYIGKQVNEDTLPEIVERINASDMGYTILFIDEVDTMDSECVKMLNPILEQFKFNGRNVRPFLFLGATINKHKLIDNNPDTLDRIPTQIKMHRYNIEEMKKIINQYKEQLYSDVELNKDNLDIIAKNCKYNPRTAISLLEDFIVTDDMNKVLHIRDIVYAGLQEIDIRILNTLAKSKKKNGELKPLGSSALAQRVGLSNKEYLIQYEPFLCEFGYVIRVPSRTISNKGICVLNKLEEERNERV